MSKKQLPKLMCRICNEPLTPTGRVLREELEYPLLKGIRKYREFECVKCKYKVVLGGH